MTESKLKKYIDKPVKVYFRHNMKAESGVIQYRPNEPLSDYFLYQGSSGLTSFYVAINHKMIGHIREAESEGKE